MTFRQSYEQRPNTIGRDDRIVVLEDGRGGRVEIWPGQGFNAYRWRSPAGAEFLYATDKFFQGDRPSRSGIPVLFPFPNRIRGGQYTWEGKSYQVPTNDPAGNNAIHGFAFNVAWRVIEAGADQESAWVTGEFQLSRDAKAAEAYWPADVRLRLTYRLRAESLSLKAVVSNRSRSALPFGLGFHPYFAVAPFGGDMATVTVYADEYWPLDQNLPSGPPRPVDEARDLRRGKPLTGLHIDDVLTKLRPPQSQSRRGLVASLRHAAGWPTLEIWTSADYQELVAFTPPHRQAVCLEPYTCTTDAINLQAQGTEAGLRVLPEGEPWRGDIVFTYLDAKAGDEPPTVAMMVPQS